MVLAARCGSRTPSLTAPGHDKHPSPCDNDTTDSWKSSRLRQPLDYQESTYFAITTDTDGDVRALGGVGRITKLGPEPSSRERNQLHDLILSSQLAWRAGGPPCPAASTNRWPGLVIAHRMIAVRVAPGAVYLGRPVLVAISLADLSGPASGVVELPLHLFWSSPDRVFSLDDPDERRRPCDLAIFLNGGLLAVLWSGIFLPGRCGRPGKTSTRSCGPRHRPGNLPLARLWRPGLRQAW